MDFTYDAYKGMIKLLKEKKYSFASYHNYYEYEKCVIMRHDIDYSLDKAVELSNIEHELGVKSTYFVLISSPFYNMFSKENIKKIKQIYDNGHEIGLHFDEVNYIDVLARPEFKIETAIEKEVKILESMIDTDVRSVSMHRPTKSTLEANYNWDNIVNSYGEEFFKGFKYVSDSRRRWREDVETIIQSDEYLRLHILTHAFWYNDIEKGIKQAIVDFIEEAKIERTHHLNQNITDLNEILK